MIGFAMCGSFCNFENALAVLRQLVESGREVLPIMSFNAYGLDTRFGTATSFHERIEALCGHAVIHTLPDAEPLGPKVHLDALVICPCTATTLSKLALGIYDTPVTLAAKAHLRTGRPLVVCLATNDALSGSLESFAKLMRRKHVYFTPLRQDDPEKKPYSLVCAFDRTLATLEGALAGRQNMPVFIE